MVKTCMQQVKWQMNRSQVHPSTIILHDSSENLKVQSFSAVFCTGGGHPEYR